MPLYCSEVSHPKVGVDAFSGIGEHFSLSQAAILLSLARQLRADDDKVVARARAKRLGEAVALSALEAGEEFPVPKLKSRERVRSAAVQKQVWDRFEYRRAVADSTYEDAYHQCAEDLYRDPTAESAASLCHMCLTHPKELVRIAAAFTYLPLTDDRESCVKVLAKGLKSQDQLEHNLAATALGRVEPKHAGLARLSRGKTNQYGRKPAHTLTLVHGTWGSGSSWYQPPNGDFYQFVEGHRPDIYSGSDFFQWSGGYSDRAREKGARDLVAWVMGHNESGLDLMAHSHGANISMLATRRGMTCGKLILLSCPVHVGKYFPNFNMLTKPVYSVRVKYDLVILADGGGQKFRHPDITEIVLPIWFDHGASHDPTVWQNHGIAGRVNL